MLRLFLIFAIKEVNICICISQLLAVDHTHEIETKTLCYVYEGIYSELS